MSVALSETKNKEIIFCDDIYESQNINANDNQNENSNSVWELNMFTNSVITQSSPYIHSSTNITQEQVNSYADEMSEIMECYTTNYGIFDVDKDIIVLGINNVDLFGPNNQVVFAGCKREDMKVVLDDIQKWMKTKNEDRYVVHVLAVINGTSSTSLIYLTMIDSYGDSFVHVTSNGRITKREWHKGIENYQPTCEYVGLSKYKFTDTMIDTVKGFYSDQTYTGGYRIIRNNNTEWYTLHCKTLERMREVAKKEFEKYEKYKQLYYKMNIQKAEEIRKKEEEKQKDMELYAELMKKYGGNLEKTLK